MVKAIVAGAAGRMGKRIINIIHNDDQITLAGAFEQPNHSTVGRDAGLVAGIPTLGINISGSLAEITNQADVLIDFTAPPATLQNAKTALKRNFALVIGTTGIPVNILKEIEDIATKTSCVMAPNMSVGINVMFKIVADMVRILGPDYDIEILEAHHRLKKDAPSGTALRLAQIAADAAGRELEDTAVYARQGITGARKADEIGIQTLRAGDITGEHLVMFGGTGERLELIHRAHNRDNFARGAVRAALWVINQPEGLYDMQDVMGLRRDI